MRSLRMLFLEAVIRLLFSARTDRRCKISSSDSVRKEVLRLNLLRSDTFDSRSPAEWAGIWNGWGPDNWPASVRTVITWAEREMEAVAAPHDEWYARSDGSYVTWRRVMNEWISNTSIVLADRYPIRKAYLWPKRAWVWSKARVAISALELGSYLAWVSADAEIGNLLQEVR